MSFRFHLPGLQPDHRNRKAGQRPIRWGVYAVCACLVLLPLKRSQSLRAQQSLDEKSDIEQLQIQLASRKNPSTGAKLFVTKANCISCHQVNGIGGMVGPKLDRVGKDLSINQIVESILLPDKTVKPEFRQTLVATYDGKDYQGSVLQETSRQLKLRNPATGAIHVVEQESIENRKDGLSAMPRNLAKELSYEEWIELIYFLSRLGHEKINLPTVNQVENVQTPEGFENPDVVIEMGTLHEKMRFDQTWVKVKPGAKVKLVLSNTDRMQHNLVICDPFHPSLTKKDDVATIVALQASKMGAEAVVKNYVPDSPLVKWHTSIVSPGQKGVLFFKAPTRIGDYPFVCTLPGHAMMMRGLLHVGDGKRPVQIAKSEKVPASGMERAEQKMKKYWPLADLGAVFSGVIESQGAFAKKPTYKGVAVRSDAKISSTMLFDIDMLKYAAGWSGGFVALRPDREDERSEYRHGRRGDIVFSSNETAGWDLGGQWGFDRPRGLGPLPRNWGQYKGHFRHGNQVIFNYTVGQMNVLDSPGQVSFNGMPVLTRTIECDEDEQIHSVHVASQKLPKPTLLEMDGIQLAWLGRREGVGTVVALKTDFGKANFNFRNGNYSVKLGAHDKSVRIRLFYFKTVKSNLNKFAAFVKTLELSDHLFDKTHGGPEVWDEKVMTRGSVGTGPGPYVVDTLTLPFENPWNSLLYTSGLDFLSNGDGVLCTSHGDVWRVSGIDKDLNRLIWKKIASGLSNPLGLKIVDDEIYVTCLDQLMKLHDLNGDQEIDFYECFNSGWQVSHTHHRFATGLETDAEGNFYFCKCSEEGRTDHGGTIIKVAKDGSKFEVYATGLRNPNGLGISTAGMMTFGKQQGGWIPSSGIHTVKRGGFYGYIPSHHQDVQPTNFEPPLCWIPHGVDNSCGGQVFAPNDKRWGPLAGQLIHFSYGKCQMFLVLHENVDGVDQGGVVRIPGIEFESGAMRGRFRQQDGQLYVTGLRGWQTSGRLPGCLERVRYVGGPTRLPTKIKVKPGSIELSFAEPLQRTSIIKENFNIQQWNYLWSKNYGSKDYSVLDPARTGRDRVKIDHVSLGKDGKTIRIHVKNLKPVMQMQIDYNLMTRKGDPVAGQVFNTINRIPDK